MKQIGEILHKKRLEKKISLDAVHKDTRIPVKFLEALEDVDPSQFPAEVYFLGFLRKYAKYLGINPDELVEIYREHLIKLRKDEQKIEAKKISIFQDVHLITLGVFVLTVAILFSIKYWLPYVRGFAVKLVEKSVTLSGSPEISMSTQTIKENIPAQAEAIEIGGLALEVKVNDAVWLKVVSDDKLVFEGTLAGETEKRWNAKDKFYFVVGYAPAVSVKLNGKTIDVKEGAVKDVNQLILTNDGIKIISQKF